ncbi:unnamed protein product, partial [Vitis vinifera]|uniref:Uncharacterized protein n=2 Tax=Vitis TaxID=3603 RepID=E0CSR9_VITVI
MKCFIFNHSSTCIIFLTCIIIFQNNSRKIKRRWRLVGAFRKHRLFTRKRNPLDHFKGSSVLDQTMESGTSTQAQHQWKQMDSEGKKVAVHEEMKRMNQLPTNSTYATHRLRVLNKILQLISIQRTTSQDAELELLFAGLSL